MVGLGHEDWKTERRLEFFIAQGWSRHASISLSDTGALVFVKNHSGASKSPLGLGVWFLFRVEEVPGSIPGVDQPFSGLFVNGVHLGRQGCPTPNLAIRGSRRAYLHHDNKHVCSLFKSIMVLTKQLQLVIVPTILQQHIFTSKISCEPSGMPS